MTPQETKVRELINQYADPEGATSGEHSHIYQVWFDGEVTLTKSGRLLGMRTLHMLERSIPGLDISDMLPEHVRAGRFVYVSDDEGMLAIYLELIRLGGERRKINNMWAE